MYISIHTGNPAGGNFRGAFGRFIFENTGLYQNILYEDEIDENLGVNVNNYKQNVTTILSLNEPTDTVTVITNEPSSIGIY
jgi:hypothetical protein